MWQIINLLNPRMFLSGYCPTHWPSCVLLGKGIGWGTAIWDTIPSLLQHKELNTAGSYPWHFSSHEDSAPQFESPLAVRVILQNITREMLAIIILVTVPHNTMRSSVFSCPFPDFSFASFFLVPLFLLCLTMPSVSQGCPGEFWGHWDTQ